VEENTILILIRKRSPRLQYVFRQIFKRILRVEYRLTDQLEEFVAHNGVKFSYTPERFGNEFHIHSSGFLYEKGLRAVNLNPGEWEGLPVLFVSPAEASLPFDLFSAIFYLISRYEEYLVDNRQTDEHGRFPAEKSIAYRLDFLHIPVVEMWLDRFKKLLTGRFPDFSFPKPAFVFNPLLAVTVSHLFKHKGIIRLAGGIADDWLHLRLKKSWLRIKYGLFKRKDPYDTFYKFIALKKSYKHALLTFFLTGTYSNYDHNIAPTRPMFKKLVKTLADYTGIGLLASYYAAENPRMFKREWAKLEELIHKPVHKVHFHYYRQQMPVSYRQLWEMEFTDDYSMGYPQRIAFRASTAHPFPFYDLTEETETDLTIHPVIISDYKLNFHLKFPPEKALQQFIETGQLIRKYGGYYEPVIHNAILSEFEEWKNWSKVYIEMIKFFSREL